MREVFPTFEHPNTIILIVAFSLAGTLLSRSFLSFFDILNYNKKLNLNKNILINNLNDKSKCEIPHEKFYSKL